MKKIQMLAAGTLILLSLVSVAEAKGRTGSHRYGGYTSHGKGARYYGGH